MRRLHPVSIWLKLQIGPVLRDRLILLVQSLGDLRQLEVRLRIRWLKLKRILDAKVGGLEIAGIPVELGYGQVLALSILIALKPLYLGQPASSTVMTGNIAAVVWVVRSGCTASGRARTIGRSRVGAGTG